MNAGGLGDAGGVGTGGIMGLLMKDGELYMEMKIKSIPS